MSGRPRTTSFAEGNKQPPNPVLGGMKVTSKYPLSPSPILVTADTHCPRTRYFASGSNLLSETVNLKFSSIRKFSRWMKCDV